jgi:hypothetical protein
LTSSLATDLRRPSSCLTHDSFKVELIWNMGGKDVDKDDCFGQGCYQKGGQGRRFGEKKKASLTVDMALIHEPAQ